MIALDPTEANSASRVPNELISMSIICEGLEGLTGADILVSPIDKPPLNSVNSMLGQMSLKKHIESGAILVQRKSGPDIVNLIRDHDQILAKMLKWTDQPWLLTVGSYYSDKDDKLIVEGKRVGGNDGWGYWSYWGAMNSWQLRGGYIDNIPRDSLMVDWYQHILKRLQNPETVHYAMPRKPSQSIMIDTENESDAESYQRVASISALATVDGLGIAKAAAITDYADNCLAHALVFLSNPMNLALPGIPKGVGSKLFANTSRWLGLKNGGIGEEQFYEVMVIDTVYPQKKEPAKQEFEEGLPY